MRDDPSIADEDPLWRRIHPTQIVRDQQTGELRPSSAAFEDPSNGTAMSVVLGVLAMSAGRDVDDVLAAHPEHSMAEILAGDARECEQAVYPAPIPEEPAHGEVAGRKTRSVKKRLAGKSRWARLRA
jgi:hypothetical protein